MRKTISILFALALVLSFSVVSTTPVAASNTWHVSPAGSDTGGGSQGDPWQTIQHAIDQASNGDTIKVHPGTYHQDEANNRNPVEGGSGSTDFNIFVDKSVTIQGVDIDWNPITDANDVEAFIVPKRDIPPGNKSTIFVQADGVVITGLDVKAYDATDWNFKTVSVIGDDVTIRYCKLHARDQVSCIYMYDPRYDSLTDTSYIQSYSFEDNHLYAGGKWASGIRMSSGPGWSGDVAGRIISGNTFDWGSYGIEFVGPGASSWDVYPVGAATVTDNSFSGQDRGSVVAWGKYNDAEGYGDVDWDGIFSGNKFDKAVIVKTPEDIVRYYDYTAGPPNFYYIRGIYSGIQLRPINTVAQAGDTIIVKAGTYVEDLVVPAGKTGLQLLGAQAGVDARDRTGDESIIRADGAVVTIQADGVVVDGFTVDVTGLGSYSAGIYVDALTENIVIRNVHVSGPAYDGVNLWKARTATVEQCLVENAGVSGITGGYSTADWTGALQATIKNNEVVNAKYGITGFLKNSLIEGNLVRDYTGEGFGIGGQFLNTEIKNNTVTGYTAGAGIGFAAYPTRPVSEKVAVEGNTLTGNLAGIYVHESQTTLVGITANFNNIYDNTLWGVLNDINPEVLDATYNWWGHASGPYHATGNLGGTGDAVSDNVNFVPWYFVADPAIPITSYDDIADTATGTGPAEFGASAGTIQNLTVVPEATLPLAGKPPLAFPHGFFALDIVGVTPGATVTVSIMLPQPVPTGTQYWKYYLGAWHQIPMTIDPNDSRIIHITLVDGGLGDADGLANGTIIDQGGPGNPLVPFALPDYVVGWDGSPISQVAVLAPWIALLAIMAGAGLLVLRRRRAQI